MIQKRLWNFSIKLTNFFCDMAEIRLKMINNVDIFMIYGSSLQKVKNIYRQFIKMKIKFCEKLASFGFYYKDRQEVLNVHKLFEHEFW